MFNSYVKKTPEGMGFESAQLNLILFTGKPRKIGYSFEGWWSPIQQRSLSTANDHKISTDILRIGISCKCSCLLMKIQILAFMLDPLWLLVKPASLSLPNHPFWNSYASFSSDVAWPQRGATSWKHQPRERSSIQMVKLLLGGAPCCIHNS